MMDDELIRLYFLLASCKLNIRDEEFDILPELALEVGEMRWPRFREPFKEEVKRSTSKRIHKDEF